MILRQNDTSPYLYDYAEELTWLQNIQTVISNEQASYEIPPNGLLTYDIAAL